MKYPLVEKASIEIEKLVPGGQGIGTNETGKKGFFWNALPGEIVTKYQIVKNKSSYFEAIAETIENPSKHRVTPKDSCYLATSPWQIMDYAYELEQKALLLKEQFRQAGIELGGKHSSASAFSADSGANGTFATGETTAPRAVGVGSPHPSAPWLEREAEKTDAKLDLPFPVQTDNADYFYRNKMEYSLYYDNEKQQIFLAFHARGSHRKIPITHSSIERPEIFNTAQAIVNKLNENHEEARKYQSLLLRCNKKGEVSGGLYENGKPHPIFNNLTDTILTKQYSYSPNGFFQINLPVYEMALKEIKNYIKTEKVLDLYAGVGTIGLSVAHDRDLTLVECNRFAYSELEGNCADNVDSGPQGQTGRVAGTSKKRYRTVLAESENALNYIAPDQTVIVDPPRAGCDAKLLSKFIEIQPETIIYLSCNPATQARDVKILLDSQKYKITSVTPFNFFPRTPHLENLIVLKKAS